MNLAALFEIVIFGIIAFVLITKLIDMLGVTDEHDLNKNKSFFGEPTNTVKDVTSSSNTKENQQNFIGNILNNIKLNTSNWEDAFVGQNSHEKAKIVNQLKALTVNIKSFDPIKFLDGAKQAFIMTIDAIKTKNMTVLEFLIDKRFINQIQNSDYQSFNNDAQIIDAKICETYSFGNSIFIKVLFVLENQIKEEWVFIKNTLDYNNPTWQISSINAV